MKGSSWTKAAPYKETQYHRTPSESIANNYSPSAQELKLKNLHKMKGRRITADNSQLIQRRRKTNKERQAASYRAQQRQEQKKYEFIINIFSS